ncbi:MAG: hypothetical protein JSV70_08355 [bacterium]|nr:MAG: hypothetical protein JSV70_08355 [bacterium]
MRTLIWLILGLALYWSLRELFGGRSSDTGDRAEAGEEMVKDPRCGVYLPVSAALKRRIRGNTVYFCSKECEEAYKSGV